MNKKSGMQLRGVPDIPELHQLLAQALEKRGKSHHVSWRAGLGHTFGLEINCPLKGGEPQWRLYSEKNNRKLLISDYTSCDVLLVYKLIASANSDSQQPDSEHATHYPESIAKSFMQASKSAKQQQEKKTAVSLPVPPKSVVPSSGELSDVSVSDLLSKISKEELTGKLEIVKSGSIAVVYVQDGLPVDATAADAVGDDAIIEMLTWDDGQFTFEERILRNNQTVHQSMRSLIEQSKAMSDHIDHLKTQGLRPNSTLLPSNADLTRNDFIARICQNAPRDVEYLANFYRSLDGKQTVDELARHLGLPRPQLIAVIYHLVTCGVIKLNNDQKRFQTLQMHPRPVDSAAIQTVMMSLRRVETGLFMYPAFLYFLEQEFFRSYRARGALSILVFEMREVTKIEGEIKRRVLSIPAIVDAALRISQVKRYVDLIAHYDSYDYAMLLPNTKAGGSRVLANKIIRALTESPLAGLEGKQLSIAFGAASIPDDFVDLSSLLGAADLAMQHARDTAQPLVLFKDIRSLTTV